MSMIKNILTTWKNKETIEGAGIKVMRSFGFTEAGHLDPFLLLDEFHVPVTRKMSPGFPWHPHRGMETVTYILEGSVRHEDSLGHDGIIGPGDVQWMTAGAGIIHQEMLQTTHGSVWGFQLWINLPANKKWMKPKYQTISHQQIQAVHLPGDVEVRVISGQIKDVVGPVKPSAQSIGYFDIMIPSDRAYIHNVDSDQTVVAYIYSGRGYFDQSRERQIGPGYLVYFGRGDALRIKTQDDAVRFLLIAGKPLKEPVAWNGPIVMNTQNELEVAFRELKEGTFIKT